MSRISFFNDDVKYRVVHKNVLKKWLLGVIQSENRSCEEINIVLCSDNQLLKINKEHLNHDYFTDIITFDYSEENVLQGELYISIDRVKNNAKDLGIKTQDELHRVFVHGILHMCGYGDRTEKQQKEMRSKENEYINKLKL